MIINGVLYHGDKVIILEIAGRRYEVMSKIGLISLMRRAEKDINVTEVFFIIDADNSEAKVLWEYKNEFRDWLNKIEEVEGFKVSLCACKPRENVHKRV